MRRWSRWSRLPVVQFAAGGVAMILLCWMWDQSLCYDSVVVDLVPLDIGCGFCYMNMQRREEKSCRRIIASVSKDVCVCVCLRTYLIQLQKKIIFLLPSKRRWVGVDRGRTSSIHNSLFLLCYFVSEF
ncbi:unnamed protein product [Brassica oleracea var. botrytis]